MPLTTYTYDPGGRLTRIDNSLWGPITYIYDAASRLTALGYPNGATTSYALADDNRLTETVGASTILSDTFRFDKPGGGTWGPRSAEARNDNGTFSQWAYSYDADARLTGVTVSRPDLSGNSTGSLPFTISPASGPAGTSVYVNGSNCQGSDNVTIYFDGVPLGQQQCSSYYDDQRQVDVYGFGGYITIPQTSQGLHSLSAVDGSLSGSATYNVIRSSSGSVAPINPSGPGTYIYGYDGVGNMTNNNGIAQTYDADNQITASGSTTFGFDNNGNQTSTSASNAPRWTYDAANHTQSYNNQSAADTFLTTGGGQRETKSVTTGGTTTTGTYDGDSIYQQTAPTRKTVYYERAPGGRLLALTDGTTVYYYGLDGHGNVANLTDRSGNVVNSYLYDPYGNSLGKTETASIVNPWQYEGAFYEPESGIYLMGARYYAPQLGRFLQQDPLGGGYAYAGSDPCNNNDSTGFTTCYHYVSGPQVSAAMTKINNDILALIIIGAAEALSIEVFAAVTGNVIAVITGAVVGVEYTVAVAVLSHEYNVLSQGQNGTSYAATGVEVKYDTDKSYNREPCPQGDGRNPEFSVGVADGRDVPALVPPH